MKNSAESCPTSEIIMYQPNETLALEVRLDAETVWLTQQQIAELFGVNQPAISKHLRNIYKSGELEEKSTYSILEYMGNDGKQVFMNKDGFVYIMTNKNKTTLYIGVTSNVCRRVYEHIKHLYRNSFTDKYNLEYCVYFEEFSNIESAIAREKELKKWNRKKKELLINEKNPNWSILIDERGFVK